MKNTARKPVAVKIKAAESLDKRYDQTYNWSAKEIRSAKDIRTTTEMVAFLESDAGKNTAVEARVIAHNPDKGFKFANLNRNGFVESFKANSNSRKKFREAYDSFANGGFSGLGGFSGGGINGSFSNTVGQDFTPLLGGPFYKQLYYYNDWLKMHQDCFFAYHHDPLGKATVNIINDFCLGRGFRVEFENHVMQAVWDAFEEANDFQNMFRNFSLELSAYGENMFWKLPDNQKYIAFGKVTLEDVPKVFIPRIRLIDPSNIVEIVTYPEDITRRLFYVWLTPTQYQTYTGKDEKTGQVVNATKLIYQQIPADQILHYTVNSVSNEKRGRSDLFAALPYFKRLRDSINYEIIAQQKNAAWAIDTSIRGDQTDIDAYMAAQAALGTIPNAGSEFVHSEAVTRQYLANQGNARGISSSFEWCLSMISGATRIPINYYGTHLSGGQTRASAIVATEPVAKMFEMRQQVLKKAVSDIAKWLMGYFGIKSEFEIHFPEIITQDRSQKLKDLYMAEQAEWISPERAAETAAAELGYRDYDFESEREKISEQKDAEPELMLPSVSPLTDKPQAGSSSAITGQEKQQVKINDRS